MPDAFHAAIIGGGPAGLMAAETLSTAGAAVDLYDAMPSLGRKFLMAGKSGMNLTHAEPFADFLDRYGARRACLQSALEDFGPEALRAWALELGIETFVGSSHRVFTHDMKAAPLLRAWLHRLRGAGVRIHARHRWLGWDERGALRFATPAGEHSVEAGVVVLALGGGSWPQLGSTGAWVPILRQRAIDVAPLRPANCGFDAGWSEHFRTRFAGQAVKSVVLNCMEPTGALRRLSGEFVITETGVEGGAVYTLSAQLRDEIEEMGAALLYLDLAPGRDLARLEQELARPRGTKSLANHLRRAAGIEGVKAGLLHEILAKEDFAEPARLARLIKALPLRLTAPRPLAEAISSAGGVRFEALDDHLMLRALPGVFCAGEMLDWEAPTGGYLLTACFATGRAAGRGALAWLKEHAARHLS
ncbi:MAG: TIGR03862 family flavoprotein [Pseudomonadota bacterium]